MCEPISLEGHYDEALQKAVGLLFITASNIEATLGFHVARCHCYPASSTIQSNIMCGGMDLKLKLQQIELCVRLLKPNYLPRCSKICTSIRRQFDHRNAIAHNSNFGPGAKFTVKPLKMTSKGLVRDKNFSASQITNIARIMFARGRQLSDLLDESGFPKLVEFDQPVP